MRAWNVTAAVLLTLLPGGCTPADSPVSAQQSVLHGEAHFGGPGPAEWFGNQDSLRDPPSLSTPLSPFTPQEAPVLVPQDISVTDTVALHAHPEHSETVPVPVRVYEPRQARATLVWAHGGSFFRGTLDWPESDWVSRRFAEAGIRTVAVDYRLASATVKAPLPAVDVATALAWAGETYPGPLAIGGASAGGQLAVHAALHQADRAADIGSARGEHRTGASDAEASEQAPLPMALLLQYPTLHATQRSNPALAQMVAHLPEGKRFRAERISQMYDFYLGEHPAEAGSALVAGELPAARLAALPPTVLVTAELDELRTSGETFAEQLRAAGVPVRAEMEPGTVHGYLNAPETSREAERVARATVSRFLRAFEE